MFLRKHTRQKDGKSHAYYWTLVETYRTAKGPRQRIVSYLGDLDEESKEGYKALNENLHNREYHQQENFFEVVKPAKAVSIYPEGVRVEHVRDFGDVWLGVSLWRKLKFN